MMAGSRSIGSRSLGASPNNSKSTSFEPGASAILRVVFHKNVANSVIVHLNKALECQQT
jgi:hypothetical protein